MSSSGRRRAGQLLLILLATTSLSGCSIYSGGTRDKVHEWVNRSAFIADINTVLSDVSDIRQATKSGTVKDLRTICAGLADDVGTTYETLPSPVPRLTSAINVPVQLMFSAANSCSLAPSLASPVTERALAQLDKGESQLKQVRSILAGFGVDWRARL